MKGLWILLFLALNFAEVVHRVALMNQYTEEASTAYAKKEYLRAITAYEYLRDSLRMKEDRVSLNLAQAYHAVGESEKSLTLYETLSQHPDPAIATKAYLQQGVLLTKQRELTAALRSFRQALVRNAANQVARYNYEALKKYLLLHPEEAVEPDSLAANTPPPASTGGEGRSEPAGGPGGDAPGGPGTGGGTPPPAAGSQTDPSQENQPDAGSDPGQETQASGQDPGETKGSTPSGEPPFSDTPAKGRNEALTEKDTKAQTIHQNLQEINLSQEKAQMLLEALNQAEMQHIQQLPRPTTKKPDPRKPDW